MESTDSAKKLFGELLGFHKKGELVSHYLDYLGFGSYLPYMTKHLWHLSRHQIPTWTWDGRVRCSTSLAAQALRSFVLFSAKPMEPLQRRDPFVCVSYMMDGTWVAWLRWIRMKLYPGAFYVDATSTCIINMYHQHVSSTCIIIVIIIIIIRVVIDIDWTSYRCSPK